MADQNNAPERIWLDERTFNGAVGFAHSKQHHPGTWTEYIRADRAAPTNNTALVDVVARAMCEKDGSDWDADSCQYTANGEEPEEQREYWRDKAEAALSALASREAPPAAQEPVAWKDRICTICDGGPGNDGPCLCGMEKWNAAPPPACQQEAMPVGCGQPCGYDCNGACFDPPACQQEAVAVEEAAQVLLDQPYEVMRRAFAAMERMQGEGADNIMAAALRALKGERG